MHVCGLRFIAEVSKFRVQGVGCRVTPVNPSPENILASRQKKIKNLQKNTFLFLQTQGGASNVAFVRKVVRFGSNLCEVGFGFWSLGFGVWG